MTYSSAKASSHMVNRQSERCSRMTTFWYHFWCVAEIHLDDKDETGMSGAITCKQGALMVTVFLTVAFRSNLVTAQSTLRKSLNDRRFLALNEAGNDIAEKLFNSAIRKSDSPDTIFALSLIGMGETCRTKGQYLKAEPHLKLALSIYLVLNASL